MEKLSTILSSVNVEVQFCNLNFQQKKKKKKNQGARVIARKLISSGLREEANVSDIRNIYEHHPLPADGVMGTSEIRALPK